jgi:AraC-like DNA-binding protein
MLDRKSESVPTATRGAPDLMSEMLMGMRLNGVDYRRIQITPPFGIRFGALPGRAQFHFVAQGPVYLRGPDGSVQTMNRGDAVLLPRGGLHDLVSDPDLPGRDVTDFKLDSLCRTVTGIRECDVNACRSGDAVFFSACMEFDLGAMHPLVALMPQALFAGTLFERYPEVLPILEAMNRETMTERAGYAGILARLADIVAASIVRAWVECGCGGASGWVEALRDPRLGRVIVALHRDPGRDWTLAALAAEMGASRSVFAERFHAVTGITPVRYLTEMRMRLAAEWIGRDGMHVETAAHRLGYGSLAAFSRAFKRVVGHPPGALRGAGRADA